MLTYNQWLEEEKSIMNEGNLSPEYENIVSTINYNYNIGTEYKKGAIFYRSRLFLFSENEFSPNHDFIGFDAKNSMAPESEDVKNMGRFNQEKESVLYMSEDEYTALVEQRAGKGNYISIAEVELLNNINVADFTFREMCGGNNGLEQIFRHLTMLCYIVVNNDVKRYRATNFISEKLKGLGYDGVKYSSSLSASGENVVLFYPEKAKANNSKVYSIPSVLYYAVDPLSQRKLYPKTIEAEFTEKEIEYFFNRLKNKKKK